MSALVPVRVVVALQCEARPLVEAFGLERERRPGRSPGGDLFRNEAIVVACSGVGKTAVASCVGWLHAILGEQPDAPWLNLGVAGGRELLPGRPAELGELALAAKVVDVAVERANAELQARLESLEAPPRLPRARATRMPPQLVRGSLPAAIVHTVDGVELDYPRAGLYEMEASGFVAAAGALASAELVQVAKVVSDTPTEPVHRLDALTVERLVDRRVPEIAQLIERLQKLTVWPETLVNVEPWEERLTRSGRWSFTQRQQLHQLLHRWAALRGVAPQPPERVAGGRGILPWLRQELEHGAAPLEQASDRRARGSTAGASGGSE